MNIQSKELDFLSKKTSSDRYVYTVKKIADFEEGWGLYCNGWALTGADGNEYFPIWPSQEAAMNCAVEHWSGYKPKSISVDYLMEELLPMLTEDNVQVAIFMLENTLDTATKKSCEFQEDLSVEMEKYE
ncbi:DUF2750 domain-containing protein [Cobetia sp. MMG027]|uniref:DUF2750 domain-containing protein n=1 Tax=Cobetia sp. MMG027 TaxID=3021980 RepID=UPI0022FE74C2|nr:DUF2750 domain-containing protein [Cobetia sp. MMG027]MDA5564518.1 DUF2750 domain-containing protein [Cobetia sp. MMG027]